MSELHANPLGVDGIEFVEYAAPDAGFDHLNLTSATRREIRTVVHRARQVTLTQPATHQFVTPRALLPLSS